MKYIGSISSRLRSNEENQQARYDTRDQQVKFQHAKINKRISALVLKTIENKKINIRDCITPRYKSIN